MKFWTIRNSEAEPTIGEVLLYGEIANYSWWGDEVTPKQFREDLDALGDVSELKVYINSGGGDVFAGQAIYSIIKRHKAKTTVYIDGLAASAASLIAMAGDSIMMPANAMLMLHNPWTWSAGEAKDFRKLADDLDHIRKSMVEAYKAKSGKESEEIIAILDAETWMTAAEAVEMGFADQIEESKQVAASLNGKNLVINGQEMDLTRYAKAPKIVISAPAAKVEPEPAGGDDNRLQLLALEYELMTGKTIEKKEECPND